MASHKEPRWHQQGRHKTQLPPTCRFRSQNGQWLAAKLLAVASDTATLQVLHPSQAYMLQPVRCTVAAIDPDPLSKQQLQGGQATDDIPLGTVLYARSPDSGLYQPAELEGVQAGGRQVVVTFVHGARSVVVPAASTCLRLAADLEGMLLLRDMSSTGAAPCSAQGGHKCCRRQTWVLLAGLRPGQSLGLDGADIQHEAALIMAQQTEQERSACPMQPAPA